MKKLVLTWCALTLCFISGCNQKVWIKDGVSDVQAKKDFHDCKYDAKKSSFVAFGGGISGASAGFQEGMQTVSLMSQCMTAKGYRLVDKFAHEERKAKNDELIKAGDDAHLAKDDRKALEMADALVAENGTDPQAYAYRAKLLSNMEKYNDAIADLNQAIKLGGKTPLIFVLKSQAFAMTGEPDIAIETANQGLQLGEDPFLYSIRGFAYNIKGDYEKALADCNKSIALDNTKPNAFKNRGLAYCGKGDYARSIEEFNKSLSLNNNYAFAYLGRGETYLKMGKTESAVADFKKACELGNNAACAKLTN